MASPMRQGDALIVVDVQNDFCPGGSLPIPAGDAVVPVLNGWIQAARQAGVPVVATRDWHPEGHVSFKPRGKWPTHCVQGSVGAEFHPSLRLPDDAIVLSKAYEVDHDGYSAFDRTNLAQQLRERGVRRLWIGGLAQDVCVRLTALDAIREGFEVMLVQGGSKPTSEQAGSSALRELEAAGARTGDLV